MPTTTANYGPDEKPPARLADMIEFVTGLRRIVRGIMEKELAAVIRAEIRNILTEKTSG